MNYLFILLYCLIASTSEVHHHEFTIINEVAELDIISLYLWGTGHSDKGNNWFTESLQPDSSVTFSIPSGKCNILAFDELGNSYGIAGNYQKNAPDTVVIDLEYISYARPNVDCGHYMLTFTNSLHGFALDTLVLSSVKLKEDIIIDDYRVFPGNSITIWLDRGSYSVKAVDQLGRIYIIENIAVPAVNPVVSAVESMNNDPQPPVGITGNGTGSLIIENCLPMTIITKLRIADQNGSIMIFLDSLNLQPGESLVAKLDPGHYSLTATGNSEIDYNVSFDQQDTEIQRLPITNDYLLYDFSFPE